MKLFSESLKADLDSKLKVIHLETSNPLQYAELAIKLLITTLEKLKTACLKYQFESKSEEIEFFRNSKPQFAGNLIYYNEIYNIESNKPLGSNKALRKYYLGELLKLENFFNQNLEFYRYYRRGNTNLDKKYFLRGKFNIRNTIDSFYFHADHRFCTSHDYKVAQILANEKIKSYIETTITKLNNTENSVPNTIIKTQKWTASKVALIELIYALHTEGAFNHGKTNLKELASCFETAFDIELGQFHRTFLEIRARKADRTKFLNTLKDNLTLRMDQADEKQ